MILDRWKPERRFRKRWNVRVWQSFLKRGEVGFEKSDEAKRGRREVYRCKDIYQHIHEKLKVGSLKYKDR